MKERPSRILQDILDPGRPGIRCQVYLNLSCRKNVVAALRTASQAKSFATAEAIVNELRVVHLPSIQDHVTNKSHLCAVDW